MSPIRLVIIAILLYILYRLIAGPRKKIQDNGRWKRSERNTDKPLTDTLVKDPVCSTYVPKKQAFTVQHDHQQYYFCSEKCRATFLAGKGMK